MKTYNIFIERKYIDIYTIEAENVEQATSKAIQRVEKDDYTEIKIIDCQEKI